MWNQHHYRLIGNIISLLRMNNNNAHHNCSSWYYTVTHCKWQTSAIFNFVHILTIIKYKQHIIYIQNDTLYITIILILRIDNHNYNVIKINIIIATIMDHFYTNIFSYTMRIFNDFILIFLFFLPGCHILIFGILCVCLRNCIFVFIFVAFHFCNV